VRCGSNSDDAQNTGLPAARLAGRRGAGVATFAAVLDTCERITADIFVPANRIVDVEEPRLENGVVVLPDAAYATARAYVESGMLAAAQDYDVGGMQLPYVVEMAANAMFWKGGISLGGGSLLTVGNANLLMAHGTPAQRRVFAHNELAGRWFGTMCLSEPQAGSGLGDILTRAIADADGADDPLGPRYRLYGNKTWISNGDHEMTENIVHLVLAKIPDESGHLPPGAKGISLFIVPKKLVDERGELTGARNDVSVAGLNHKLGYRGLPNTLLNFGEGRHPVDGAAGAIGYRVGRPGEGLKCMFHMMNEARIAVGLGAAAVGFAGYEASLRYARERRQGRALTADGKSSAGGPVPIIEHPDVRRMLLAQKAYVEGALALSLYCARLVDEVNTAAPDVGADARRLLELLTPVAKSWPSEWGVEANSLAIQVHGGYGYTRDFPVEQYWRDNRLNMIHEGTHGIQGLDLLGRKVRQNEGAAMRLLRAKIDATIQAAESDGSLKARGDALRAAFGSLERAIEGAWMHNDHVEALANATPFLQAFGHVVVAWLWLDVGLVAGRGSPSPRNQGLCQAMAYFYDFELPKIGAWLGPVEGRSPVCRQMQDEWFDA
jgi:alkylation response protein AidB-like acyl-CoA dehydrogenase